MWKFISSWEQRDACRGKWKFPLKTFEEAEEAKKDFSHYWRGTETFFRVVKNDDGYTLLQGLEGKDL